MRLINLAVGLLASTVAMPALAADIVYQDPVAPIVEFAPAYTWTGFYIGGQAGAAFSDDSSGFGRVDDFSFSGDGRSDDDAVFVGGVHIGYDYQIDNLIIGAVADISYICLLYTSPSPRD